MNIGRPQMGFVLQHIEKVVLAAAAAAALVLIWRYSLGSPYRVELSVDGLTRTVAPADVGDEVESAARSLERRLESPQVPPELNDLRVADYVKVMAERLDRRVASGPSTPLGPPGLPAKDFVVKGPETSRLVEVPPPPPPRDLVMRAGYGVLKTDIDPRQLEQYVALIGDQEPKDFRYVTVGGVVDLEQWQRLMNAVPLDRQLNASWQRSALFVVDLILQRQQLDPATGQWSAPVTIEPLPGQLSFRGVQIAGHDDAEAVLQAIRDQQPALLQPPFAPLAGGPAWQPPTAAAPQLDAAANAKLAQLTRDIERLKKNIALYQQQIQLQQKRAAGETRRTGRPVPDSESAPPEGTPSSFGGSATEVAPRTAAKPRQTPEEQLSEAQTQLNQKLEERLALLQQMQQPAAAPQAPAARSEEAAATAAFWIHDLTVRPAATYRYRVIAHMINPLFQRQQFLAPEQRAQAEALTIASAPTDWSSPVTIDPEYQLFVVAGSADQRYVSAEVYRLRSGVWSKFTFGNLHPGDPLIAPATSEEAAVPCESGLVLLDVVRSEDGGVGDTLALFLNQSSGEIREHSVKQDTASPQRQRLANDQVLSELSKQVQGREPGQDLRPSETPRLPKDGGLGDLPLPESYQGPANAG